ncbi:MAG TPA: GNAT family N-acetyltransferase [Acidimicrobiia bacterium]|nr:GNAT family N-acetyltransferase [Acidimicrobiia bacterium]
MELAIRSGRPKDLEAVRAFTTGTFEWGDYVPGEFLRWLEDPHASVLIAADHNDAPVAVGKVKMLSTREAWLSGARVHPDYRRQGIGSALNDFGVEWARERGALVIRLATEDNNTAARAQVEKLGYRAVARFAMARREFEKASPVANGGQRLPADERLDLASSSEAEPAYLVWSSGDLPAASHGLYASDGWAFRRLQANDLLQAAKRRQLWTSPSAWAIIEPDEGELWLPLFVTTPEDASRGARALTDLGHEQGVEVVSTLVPMIDWLEDALVGEHFSLLHPNHIYEKAL